MKNLLNFASVEGLPTTERRRRYGIAIFYNPIREGITPVLWG